MGSRESDFSEMLVAHATNNHEQVIATALRVFENPPNIEAHIEALRCYGAALVQKGAYERAMTAYREMELLCRSHDKCLVIPMAKQVAVFYLLGLSVVGETMQRLLERQFNGGDWDFACRIINSTTRPKI
jgi:hypothetical protein